MTCPGFKTFETDREYNTRRRATELRVSRQHGNTAPSNNLSGKRQKTFNLTTYKLHSLGDYVVAIKTFGTTDSYSTQIVSVFTSCPTFHFYVLILTLQGELEHRTIKRHYAQTNKQQFVDQMANKDTLEMVHERMNNELALHDADTTHASDRDEEEHVSQGTGQSGWVDDLESLELQYNIAQDQAHKIYLPIFLKESKNVNDPAYKVCTQSRTNRH